MSKSLEDPILPGLFFIVGILLGSFINPFLALPFGVIGAVIGIYFTFNGVKLVRGFEKPKKK